MSKHATATFDIKSWDEKPYDLVENAPKLTRASVTQTYKGDIEGEGTLEYLMAYRKDGAADFVCMQRIVGRLEGRSGSFVLLGSGSYENDTARGDLNVVPDSGTGDLRGLRGRGTFIAHHEPPRTLTLDYDFE